MSEFGKKTEHKSASRFVALIGDIVDSKRIQDRAAFQRKLQTTLARLNEEPAFAGVLAANLDLTAGDEIQGLLARPGAVVALVTRLADELAPERLVVGVGWGGLTTDPSPRVSEMDGPCFHHAREALAGARKADSWVAVKGFGKTSDEVVDALFLLIHTLRSRWTDKQAQYARAARGMLRKDVAARYGVSPSVVSESLKAAAFDALRRGEDALERALSEFGSEAEYDPSSASQVKP